MGRFPRRDRPSIGTLIALICFVGIAHPARGQQLSYAGRLVAASGEPVAGPVTLRLDFFHAPDDHAPVLTLTHGLESVVLADGAFTIALELSAAELQVVFPTAEQLVFVEVTDLTHRPDAPYPRQRFGATPIALKVPVDAAVLRFDASGKLTLAAGTLAHTHTLSGDASGDLATTVVTKLQGRDVAATAPASGNVLKWNGAAWAPAPEPTATLGNLGCASGEVLKWSGTAWACATDAVGATTNAADLTSGTLADARLSTNVSLFGNAVETNELADGAVTALKIADASVTAAKLAVNGCTTGQMLKFNGTAWACASDAAAVTDAGLLTTGTLADTRLSANVSLLGSAIDTADLAASAVTTAKLADASVTAAKLATNSCASGQLLKFNGTLWACANDIDTNTPTTDASQLTTGTLSDARLSSNVSRLGSAIDTAELADGAVTTAKLAAGAVGDAQVAAGVDAAKLAGGSVSNTELGYLDGVTSALQTQLNGKLVKAGDTMTGGLVVDVPTPATADAVAIKNSQRLRFENDQATPNFVSFRAATGVFTNQSYVLPSAAGTAGQVLKTDAAGNLSWWTPGNTVTSLAQITVSCTTGQVIKSDGGGSWSCQADADSAGAAGATPADGSVATAKIVDGAVTAAKLSTMGCSNGQILKYNGAAWACSADDNNNVTSNASLLTSGTVAEARLSANVSLLGASVDTAEITDGAVTTVKLAAGAVGSAQITDGSVAAVDLAGSIPDSKLATLTTAGKVSGDTITSGTIAGSAAFNGSGSLQSSGNVIVKSTGTAATELRFNDDDNSNYVGFKAPATIGANKIWTLPAADASGFLQSNGSGVLAWTASAPPSGAAGGDLSGTFPNPTLGNGVITTAKLAAGAVTTTELGANAVTTAKLGAGAVTTTELGANAVTTAKLAAGAVTTTELGANAVTTAKLAAGAVTTTEIADGTIATADVANNAITAAKLLSDAAVDANRAVGTDHLKDGAVTSAKIADATIVNADISASAAIADSKLATISTAGKVADAALSANVTLLGSAVDLNTVEVTGVLTTGKGGTGADGSALAQNLVLASPAGASGAAAYRALAIVDLPTHTTAKLSDFNSAVDARIATTHGVALDAPDGSPTSAVAVDNAGHVGIGTTTPGSVLSVNGEVQVGTTGAACAASNAGALQYASGMLQVCNGSSWGPSSASPTGLVAPFPTSACPTGWLEANGTAVSRTTYAGLYTAIGTMYGSGDGSTTFTLPDYRGYFVRGWSHGAGRDPDAASRTNRGDGTTGDNVGTVQVEALGAHSHSVIATAYATPSGTANGSVVGGGTGGSGAFTTSATASSTGGNETRPKNINAIYCISTGTIASTTVASVGSGTASYLAKWSSSTALGNSVLFDNGSVGIGTTSPQGKLHVEVAASSDALATKFFSTGMASGEYVELMLGESMANYKASMVRYQNGAGNAATATMSLIHYGDTYGLTLLGGGNVGIGVNSPGNKLQVNGAITATGANAGAIPSSATIDYVSGTTARFLSMGPNTSTRGAFSLAQTRSDGTSYQEVVTIGSGGNMNLIGCYQSNGSTVAGSCASDARLKRDVEPITGALQRVLAIRPVHYKYRSDEHPDLGLPTVTQVGVIAQELETVLPELVTTSESGFKQVHYGLELSMQTLAAVQELDHKVDDQSAATAQDVQDLKAQVASLKAALCALDATADLCGAR